MFLTSFTISVLRGCDWTAAESDGNKQNWNHIAVKKQKKKTTEAPSTASQRSVFSTSHVLTLVKSQKGSPAATSGDPHRLAMFQNPTLIVTSTSSPSTNAPSHRETYKHTVHHLSRQQSDMMGNETQRTQTNPGFVVIARKKNHTCLCVNVFRYIHF